jgi:Protein of unknown function (DUF2914)
MMTAYRLTTALFAVWLCLGGCNEGSADGAPSNTQSAPKSSGNQAAPVAASSAATTTAATTTPAQKAADAPGTRIPIELLGLTITSAVEKKEPVDKLKAATPGTRVYAHLKLRNRSNEARTVRVDFLVNGKLRTPLKLEVEPSWSFRTWGYNTVQASDTGELEVQVYDDAGAVLEKVKLPIQAK